MESPIMRDVETLAKKMNPEWIITLLFVIFLGFLGVHRFYNGKIGTGILMIITLGGLGIWTFIDFIIIVMGRFKDSNGTVISIQVPTTPTTPFI